MKIYIATSWRNQHAVEMLTELLEQIPNVEVRSFVRNANEEPLKATEVKDFIEWLWSERGEQSFIYDTTNAMECDLTIAISPLGKDSCMEIGMAYAKGKPVVVLHSKGEDLGLMRRVFLKAFNDYKTLLTEVREIARDK